jgi:hypothetical protein
MAELYPNEGLDYILSIIPGGGAAPANLYLGLFTGATAATTPAATAVLATQSGVTEAAFTGYARRTIAAAAWGATGAKTMWGQAGRGKTAAEQTFPAATAAYATAINGFFIASAATGGIALFYSNFDDEQAIASLALGDIIKVTPTLGFLG